MKITLMTMFIEEYPYLWFMEIDSMKIGVNKNKGWCAQIKEGRLISFDSVESCMPLAPILEIEEKIFFRFLECIAFFKPDYSEAIYCFPKYLLIKYIFQTSFSGYWPERALEWLVSDENIQPLFQDELERLIGNKVMPQILRQRAKKMLRRIENEGNA